MFSWVSLLSGIVKIAGMIAGMFRDARLRRDGMNAVAAASAVRTVKGRMEAYEIRTDADATAVARRMSKRRRF